LTGPPQPFDRVVDSVEWMVASSGGGVLVGRIDGLDVDPPSGVGAPAVAGARFHVEEFLGDSALPDRLNIRFDGVPIPTVRNWQTDGIRLLVFVTITGKREAKLTPSRGNDWRYAVVPLDGTGSVITLTPSRVSEPRQILSAVRRAVAETAAAGEVLLVPPGGLIAPTGPGAVTGSPVEVLRLTAPEGTWYGRVAARWLASSGDPRLRRAAVESLALCPTTPKRMAELLTPVLNDPAGETRGLFAGVATVYPLRERAYQALARAGVSVAPPTVEDGSLYYRLGRVTLMGLAFVMAGVGWRAGRGRTRVRLRIPRTPGRIVLAWVYGGLLVIGILWVAGRFDVALTVNAGEGTLNQVRLESGMLAVHHLDGYPYLVSQVGLTHGNGSTGVPAYSVANLSGDTSGPFYHLIGTPTGWGDPMTAGPTAYSVQSVRLAYPLIVLLCVAGAHALSVLSKRVLARRRARGRGFCRACGYDLRGTPARCPECGVEGYPVAVALPTRYARRRPAIGRPAVFDAGAGGQTVQ